MASIKLKRILQVTLQKMQSKGALSEDDPSLIELKSPVVRSMAELEVGKLEREPAALETLVNSETPKSDGESPLKSVA